MITMSSKEAARAVAVVKQLESKVNESGFDIANSISMSFQALITLNPNVALDLLKQLNQQVTEEAINDMVTDNQRIIDEFVEENGMEEQ